MRGTPMTTVSDDGSGGGLDVAAFDLMNLPADFVPEAYRYFAALRATSPIHRNSDGSFLLTRYDDLVTAYRNPAV